VADGQVGGAADEQGMTIVVDEWREPNLRKLARALISLARRQLDERPNEQTQSEDAV
jgi:hypothetical protein